MSKRQVFFSFHYDNDAWRAATVRNMGIVEGNSPVSDNIWEEVERKGDRAIQKWIDENLQYRSCTIVLIGEHTAGRKWLNYEIKKSWEDGKGLLGIYVHRLLDQNQQQARKGENPFDKFTIQNGDVKLSSVISCYNPQYNDSRQAYAYIKNNLADWIEKAIEERN